MKQILGRENYLITADGKVFSSKSKIYLLPIKGRDGYLYVNLWKNCKNKRMVIHRLVAQAYLENRHNKRCVNHKDGNKENNSVQNLEWCTHSENLKHAYATGLQKDRTGSNNPVSKINEAIAKQIKIHLFIDMMSQAEVSRKLSISREIIRSIYRGLTWKHVNFLR